MNQAFNNLTFVLVPVIFVVLGMRIHDQTLTEYLKYDPKRFKLEHHHQNNAYLHLYRNKIPYRDEQAENIGDVKMPFLPIIGLDILKVPDWALNWNKVDPISMSIFVLSAPANFVKRHQMRRDFNEFLRSYKQSYDAHRKKLQPTITFLIGVSSNNTINVEVDKELERHRDILKLYIKDSYTDCAYKVLASFEWIYNLLLLKSSNIYSGGGESNDRDNLTIQNFKEPNLDVLRKDVRNKEKLIDSWVVKVDDDMIINYDNLIRTLDQEMLEIEARNEDGSGDDLSILCSAVLNHHVAEWRNDSMTRKW